MSAVDNFQNGQTQLAMSMTAPLQAGQTQAAPYQTAMSQTPKKSPFEEYQERIGIEARKASDLAKDMQNNALKAGQAAVSSGVQSAQASSDLKQINAGGRIQAKHPLDLLAIGIRGWKANKAQKASISAAGQAKQDALLAADAAQKSKEAREESQYLRRKELDMQAPEDKEMTKARMEAAYLMEDNAQEANGIPPDKRQFSVEAMGGQDIISQRGKESRMQGTGELTTGAKTKVQTRSFQLDKALDSLRDVKTGFKPEYMTAMSDAKAWLGDKAEYAGWENDWAKDSAEKQAWQGNVMSYVNQLIKDRSGAAVTASEYERLKKELFGNYTGATKFNAKLRNQVNMLVREKARMEHTISGAEGKFNADDYTYTSKEFEQLGNLEANKEDKAETQGSTPPPTFVSPMGEELTDIQQSDDGKTMIGYSAKLNDWVEVRQ